MELRFCEQDIELLSKEIVKKVCEALTGQSLFQCQNLLTAEELATRLSIPKSWIYDRTRDNTIPHVKVGKYVRFSLPDILTWLKANHD
ncbi:MAG: helix-turn-helix domain-containing protein [Pseudomonadota bacterium]